MTEDKALHEKLDAMAVDLFPGNDPKRLGPIEWRVFALDLLRRLEERDTPCVWSPSQRDEALGRSSCGKWVLIGYPYCPYCRHPVQVKQPQDAAEEE